MCAVRREGSRRERDNNSKERLLVPPLISYLPSNKFTDGTIRRAWTVV